MKTNLEGSRIPVDVTYAISTAAVLRLWTELEPMTTKQLPFQSWQKNEQTPTRLFFNRKSKSRWKVLDEIFQLNGMASVEAEVSCLESKKKFNAIVSSFWAEERLFGN